MPRPHPLLAAALLLAPITARAQAAAEPHPAMQVVTTLFDAMRARDTAAMRAAFVDHAVLASWAEREGQVRFRRDSLSAFLVSVANAPKELVLDERIYAPKVEVSDGLASVWTEYDFYAGSRFSHCGVDAFHLARTGAGWKIVHLIDTRRASTDCPKR
jgi:hypothetical protein